MSAATKAELETERAELDALYREVARLYDPEAGRLGPYSPRNVAIRLTLRAIQAMTQADDPPAQH